MIKNRSFNEKNDEKCRFSDFFSIFIDFSSKVFKKTLKIFFLKKM